MSAPTDGRLYVDTSALGRVLLVEPDARLIRDVLADNDEWWSSELIVVEFRRLAGREGLADPAERLLELVRLIAVDSPTLQRASLIEPWSVRSLDRDPSRSRGRSAHRRRDRRGPHLRPPTSGWVRASRPDCACSERGLIGRPGRQ